MAPVTRQRNTPTRFDNESVPNVFPSAEDMYGQWFNEVVDTVVHSSPGTWQHMAHTEHFSTGNDDSMFVLKVYGQDHDPESLQLHCGMLAHIAKRYNTPVKTFQDVFG